MRRTNNQFVDGDGEVFRTCSRDPVYMALWRHLNTWETLYDGGIIERL